MELKGIVFDFNGTLFFDSHYHNQVWKQLAKELRGTELSDEEMNGHIHGKNNEKIIDYITDHTLTKEENLKISKRKEQMYRELCMVNVSTTVLAPGVLSLFQELKDHHIPFTIASASIKENIDFYISQFGLDQWMDPNTITYDDGSYEDKVKMFAQAAHNIGCSISECLVFEDSASGIRFAHEVGAKGIIAIDSIKERDRYTAFPYLLGIYDDFTPITYTMIKNL